MLKTSTLAPWIALLALSCADLRTLSRNQCGNGIIELGEDCDGIGIGDSKCSSACRLLCTDESVCPGGWGCGSDGLCRQPTGQYEPFGTTLSLSADRLTLADFDGDGRSDVLATRGSTFTIAYLDPSGLQSKTTTVSFAEGARGDVPAAGDVDGDKQADLAFRQREGLAILRGQADRTLTANAFSGSLQKPIEPDDQLVAADVDQRPEALGDEVFAFRSDGLYVVNTASQMPAVPSTPLLKWQSGKGKLAGPVYAGYYIASGTSPGLVFAFEGDDGVTFYQPLAQEITGGTPLVSWNVDGALAAPVKVKLPAGAKVKNGAFFASAQLSQNTYDLWISGVDAKNDPQMFVAYRSNGGFASTYQAPAPDNMAAPFTLYGPMSTTPDDRLLEAPLFVGDLNFDNMGDLVCPRGVFVSTCNLGGCTAMPPSAGYKLAAVPDGNAVWTKALNPGNGYVYLASSEPGLTLLRGNGLFNTFRIPTQAPVKNLAVADLDGDGANDLAFSQVSARDPSLESLHVSFGSPLQIPTAPVDLGDLGAITQIAVARTQAPAVINDALPELFVQAGTFYRFDGSTDRQIQSPLVLTEPCNAAPSSATSLGTPRASAMGLFDDQSGNDVAVLYEKPGGGYALWSIDPRSRISSEVCASKIGPGDVGDLGSDEIAMLSADLDGDGRDEVLILPRGAPELIHARIGAGGSWVVETITLDGPYTGITVADLGARAAGKAALDVLLWSDSGVAILWNDGTGELSSKGAAKIDIAKVECDGAAAGKPLGVAALNMDADGEREIVVVTGGATLTLDFEDATQRKLRPAACASDALAGGGQAVTTGDVDGNGVADLVIARSSGIQIFAGTPVVK